MCFDTVEFGKRLRELREESGMTQEELAQKVNVEKQHINRMENGKRACSIDSAISLSEVLHTSTDYLLIGKETSIEQIKNELMLVVNQLFEIVQKM